MDMHLHTLVMKIATFRDDDAAKAFHRILYLRQTRAGRPPEGYKRYNPISEGPTSDILARMALFVVRIDGGQKTARKYIAKGSVGGTHVVNP